jgi:hypothetical protein
LPDETPSNKERAFSLTLPEGKPTPRDYQPSPNLEDKAIEEERIDTLAPLSERNLGVLNRLPDEVQDLIISFLNVRSLGRVDK